MDKKAHVATCKMLIVNVYIVVFEAINWANNVLTQFHDFSSMTGLFDNDSQSKGRSTKKSQERWPKYLHFGCMISETVS